MPTISVIVPNYNHAPYLRQRLDSIFNQTFQDFEVIILDDCSTDNSKEIIEEYRNYPQVSHVVYNEINSGSPFKQWAKGFDLAKGEYIWIAESDDWAERTFLENTVQIIEKKEVSLVFTNSVWVFERDFQKENNVFPKDTFLLGNDFLFRKMITKNAICNASCVLFKKETLSKIPSYYQTFKALGDWVLWIEFCLRENVYYISKPLNFFRQHTSNLTKKNVLLGNTYQESFKVYDYIKTYRNIPLLKRHIVATFFLTYPQKIGIDISKSQIYKETSKKWKKEICNPIISRVFVNIMFVFWIIKKFVFSIFNKEIDDFF